MNKNLIELYKSLYLHTSSSTERADKRPKRDKPPEKLLYSFVNKIDIG